jgi:hypothetical protein
MGQNDEELQAIQAVISALSSLDETARTRVLEYVFSRLDFAVGALSREYVVSNFPASAPPEAGPVASRPESVTDIRSLKEAKSPRSANEMATVVAYYLSELAPPGERRDTINTDDIQKYFKQAGYPLPKQPRVTLANATNAGYFDSAGGGQYRLNPVGYNLVVHNLPRKMPVEGGQRASARRKTSTTKQRRKATRTGASPRKRKR